MSPFTKVVFWFVAANALFGLIGLLMHWLQGTAARPLSEGHSTSAERRNEGMDNPEVSTTGKESR